MFSSCMPLFLRVRTIGLITVDLRGQNSEFLPEHLSEVTCIAEAALIGRFRHAMTLHEQGISSFQFQLSDKLGARYARETTYFPVKS